MRLARAGHRVTVVDYREKLGDKLCTGIVSLNCLREFPASEEVVYNAAQSLTLEAPSGRRLSVEKDTPQACVIDRVAYVADIGRQARDAGATYLLGRTVTAVHRRDDSILVEVDGTGEVDRIEAKIAVIATGFGSSFTKQLGLGRIDDCVMGTQVEVLAPSLGEVEIYMGEAVAPGFFAWLVPTMDGKALLGLLSRSGSGTYLRNLAAALKKRGKVSAVVGETKRWGIPLKPLSRTTDDRVVVVGDAAGQVKPTTGGGIYYALLSSKIAGSVIHQALAAESYSAQSLSPYEVQWKALLSEELLAGCRIRKLAENLKDWQLEQIMRIVSANGFLRGLLTSTDVSFDWHGRLAQKLLGFPGLANLLKPLGFTHLWRRLARLCVGGSAADPAAILDP